MSIKTNSGRFYDSNSSFHAQDIPNESENETLFDCKFVEELEKELHFLQQLSKKRMSVVHQKRYDAVLVYPKVDRGERENSSLESSTFSRRKNVNIDDLMSLFGDVGFTSCRPNPNKSSSQSTTCHKHRLESCSVGETMDNLIQSSSPAYVISQSRKKQRRRFSRVATSA